MNWDDSKQVLKMWVELREKLLLFGKESERSRDELFDRAGELVVAHEAPLAWVDRLVFTVSRLVLTKSNK